MIDGRDIPDDDAGFAHWQLVDWMPSQGQYRIESAGNGQYYALTQVRDLTPTELALAQQKQRQRASTR